MTESTADVTIVRVIPAQPREVFEAWLDPDALSRFMCPPEGTAVSRVDVDPRAGGKFLIVMRVGERELPHRGEYLEIERYERLAFTWHSAFAGLDSRVVLQFEPAPNGQTKLTLHHAGLHEESNRRRHESGWNGILSALDATIISRAIPSAGASTP